MINKVLIYPILWLMDWLRRYPLGPIFRWMEARPAVRQWMGVLRLGLFQFGVGLSLAPVTGTLNRVLIDELRISATVVALLISLHYFMSPVRAVIGYRSDKARSLGKWRTPYLTLGVILTYGGLALAPFSLILLGGFGSMPFWAALVICLAIFAAYGAGVSIVETIYLALVSDITPPQSRGKVLAFLWAMLILGTVVSAVLVSGLLIEYSHELLIRVMQGSAMTFVFLTVISMWHQEPLNRDGTVKSDLKTVRIRLSLWESLRLLGQKKLLRGFFGVIFVAMMAFATHDVLLEPYGGQVLGMSVSETMRLTALWGVATIVGVTAAALLLWRKQAPVLLIGLGCVLGVTGFLVISLAGASARVDVFRVGVAMISAGRGLFLVGSVILVMSLTDVSHAGFLLGVWGIVQAMGQGFGTIGGGVMRDLVYFQTGNVALGYVAVYMTSMVLLLLVILILVFRLGSRLNVSEIKLPWSGLEEIPADQLAF
jgi:MFS transporter, BCD family, chlorophyll transporter